MDGFIGLDMRKVGQQLEEVKSVAFDALQQIKSASTEYLTGLRENWASPRAVEVTNDFRIKISDLLTNTKNVIDRQIDKSCDAANALNHAMGNGGEQGSMDSVQFHISTDAAGVGADGSIVGLGCSESLNGVVGMNTEKVEELTATFRTNLDRGVTTLSTLQRTIGFYSPDGALVNAYSMNVEKIVDEFNELASNLYTNMQNCIETETNAVLTAKQAAEDTLRG